LIDGIADIPPIPSATSAAAASRYTELGGERFREELRRLDPATAARLMPGDGQRLQRAWAVALATGRPLSAWQAETPGAPAGLRFGRILLQPPRPVSAEAVERRFRAMIAAGALEEVRRLASRGLDPSLPIMKALGVPPLLAHLAGRIGLDEAAQASVIATRQYAKRQRTWFRHQFQSDLSLDAQFSESRFQKFFPKIRELVLTPDS
jgi:tRNA dimethylallyltransferase